MGYNGKLNHVKSRAVRLAWTMSCFLCLASFGLLLGSLSDLLLPAFPLHCFLRFVHCFASANKLTASLKNLLHLASVLLYHWLDFRLALDLASSHLLTGLPHPTYLTFLFHLACLLLASSTVLIGLLHQPCSISCFVQRAHHLSHAHDSLHLACSLTSFVWLAASSVLHHLACLLLASPIFHPPSLH